MFGKYTIVSGFNKAETRKKHIKVRYEKTKKVPFLLKTTRKFLKYMRPTRIMNTKLVTYRVFELVI